MTQYVKLTLKEFKSIRSEIESGYAQSGQFDCKDAIKNIEKAVKAVKAVEKRNNIPSSPFLDF